jgi:hypothetical protein
MLEEEDLREFLAYYRAGEALVVQASRDQIADAARLLAVQVAYYMKEFGPMPTVAGKTLEPVTLEERDRLTEAMSMFIKAVALVMARDERPYGGQIQ